MKHRSATLLALLLVLCLLMPVWAFGEAAGDTVDILFLGTSDVHGQLYATDYTADVSQSGQYAQGPDARGHLRRRSSARSTKTCSWATAATWCRARR